MLLLQKLSLHRFTDSPVLYLLLIVHTCNSCLPGPGLLSTGYVHPYYPGYASTYSGGIYEPSGVLPLGPFRSEANSGTVTTASAFNCHTFNENCRWSNTNEDELDWKIRSAAPESENWIHSLNTVTLPDQGASVLFSTSGNGWEVGQLVSDQLPCMTSPLQLTATVWRTISGPPNQQPNLQICSRNMRNEVPVANCHKIAIQNGVPITVDVPLPHDPLAPTQIVLMGDNFVGSGGAIYVQDIVVDGRIEQDCSMSALDSRSDTVDDSSKWTELETSAPYIGHHGTQYQGRVPARMPNSITGVFDSFYDTCTTLSCNPAETECKWYASGHGWVTAVAQRFSNPLTGVQMPPDGIRAFLVAPFNGDDETLYQMTSPTITVPSSSLPTYFCFYEFFALEGARLLLCTDKTGTNCFYIRKEIDFNVGEQAEANRKWRYRCAEMPIGTYEVTVTAENHGPNKGDIGFVPSIVTHSLLRRSNECERETPLLKHRRRLQR